jgi:excinuclease UvrABC helicase subunit UvrB
MREVATIVATRLKDYDVLVSVVGGSAVTLHAPQSYTSMDIDLAALSGIERSKIDDALASLGYTKNGRNYLHSESRWTIDIVADTPFIGNRPIEQFATIATQFGEVNVLRIEDALADRIAHFLHWSDSEALSIAAALAREKASEIDWNALTIATDSLDASDAESKQRLAFAMRTIRRAIG